MLPIENENYGMLYSFQPNYLAQLISDDSNSPNAIDNAAKPSESFWATVSNYIRTLLK